jgi:monoamine oxidase
MSRTLFGTLRHRYGPPRQSLTQSLAAARAAGSPFRAPLPVEKFQAANGLTVTVAGAGFAGLTAACFLRESGFDVTVLEARPDVGGRVASYTNISDGRVIEAGAELIGANHPLWLALATSLGLGLSVLTSEDEFTGAGLQMPLYLQGQLLAPQQADDVYDQMNTVLGQISKDAATIGDPYRPWESPNAAVWDQLTVADMLAAYGVDPSGPLWAALAAELGNNQALPIEQQSYLGLTSVVRGGQLGDDTMAFWTQSEIYRCEAGNQQLARTLAAMLDASAPGSVKLGTPVQDITVEAGQVTVTAGGTAYSSDYAVLAVPQPAWQGFTISPAVPVGYQISTGPAVKYLSPVTSRFWLPASQAPSGLSDSLGMTWEGTDNQMVTGGQGIELSVFAGGPSAQAAIAAPDRQQYFTAGLAPMYPGYPASADGPGTFVDWPGDPWTGCGYSCPTVGQVTTAGPLLDSLYAGRLAFAGEHTVMAMFGYMEGALESGFLAAMRILDDAQVAPLAGT